MTMLDRLAELTDEPFVAAYEDCPHHWGVGDSHPDCKMVPFKRYDHVLCVSCWQREYNGDTDEYALRRQGEDYDGE